MRVLGKYLYLKKHCHCERSGAKCGLSAPFYLFQSGQVGNLLPLANSTRLLRRKLLVITNISIVGMIFTSLLFSQSKYPADSVLTSPNASILEKAAIRPIAAWQRISHNTDLLNCQFYPSCSQYGAIAIKENGILKGLPMAADRIVRCNPSAFSNHIHMHGKFHKKDYRLVDYTQPDFESSNSKSPVLAGILSALLPGAGRVYAGKWFDGFMGFVMVFLTATSAYESSKRDNMFNKVFSYSMAGIFYTGEIYGAYRSAKYYQRQ